MDSIVILADFTPESRTALEYGYALAIEKRLPVALIHIYDVPLLYTPDAFSGTFLPIEDAQRIAADSLQKLLEEYAARFPQVPTTTRLALMGPEAVLDGDGHTANSLVILGVDPATMNDWWEDHRGLDILRDSSHNVLAVQRGYEYKPIQRMVLALRSDQTPDVFPLAPLQSVLSLTGASLDVVTVNSEGPLSPAILSALTPLGATFHEAGGNEAVDTILARFVVEHPADWLAVVPGEYGFWAGLFHKSHTLALAGHSSVPLLALHLPPAGA